MADAGETRQPMDDAWNGEHCQVCGKGYSDVYWLPDAWWEAMTPKPDQPGAGLLCPDCALVRLTSWAWWGEPCNGSIPITSGPCGDSNGRVEIICEHGQVVEGSNNPCNPLVKCWVEGCDGMRPKPGPAVPPPFRGRIHG